MIGFVGSSSSFIGLSIGPINSSTCARRETCHSFGSTQAIRKVRSERQIFRCTPKASATSDTATQLGSFLESARDLGTVRFIAVTPGAVLETIGRFDYSLSTFSIPGKGDYFTLANIERTFECHLNASKVSTITISTEKAKVGPHQIHVVRFLSDKDDIILSAMLMWDPSQGPGNYLQGAVEEFEKMKQKYGERFQV